MTFICGRNLGLMLFLLTFQDLILLDVLTGRLKSSIQLLLFLSRRSLLLAEVFDSLAGYFEVS